MRILLLTADELRELPDGAILTDTRSQERLIWVRAYARPHQDPDTGIWTLPRNPFTEWDVGEIEVELPDPGEAIFTGDEAWLSTLDDPHDTTRHH